MHHPRQGEKFFHTSPRVVQERYGAGSEGHISKVNIGRWSGMVKTYHDPRGAELGLLRYNALYPLYKAGLIRLPEVARSDGNKLYTSDLTEGGRFIVEDMSVNNETNGSRDLAMCKPAINLPDVRREFMNTIYRPARNY